MRKHIKDVITIIIAVYAAGLSTLVFIDQRKAAQPQVVVSIAYEIGPDANGNDIPRIGIRAVNMGDEPVWLAEVVYGWNAPLAGPLKLGVREPFYGWSDIDAIEKPVFPVELQAGRARVVWYDMQQTIDYLEGLSHENTKTIHLRYVDETGQEYRSQPEDWQTVLLMNDILHDMLAAGSGTEYLGHEWEIGQIIVSR